MRYSIWERLKSPVVIGQIIVSIFALVTAVTGQDYGELANKIVIVVTALAAVFAAVNNPTTPNKL
jgi:uncharacterized membrane protein